MEIPCTLEDSVQCLTCMRTLQIKKLKPIKGHKFPKSDKSGSFWQTVYYHCRCDKKHQWRNPLVYDPGDGNLILSSSARALLLQISHALQYEI